jgi:antitoxin (DNA-binding transcriptional repressor) of toxin-antitoxin stability system
MERIVAAFQARRSFGKLIQDVLVRGDQFVIERHGEPGAAVVPSGVYRQWQRRRQEFFGHIREVSEQASVAEEEAEALVADAVQAVRSHG